MRGSGLTEARALAVLREELADFGPRTAVGIGDDAAVLEASGRRQVWTIDACVEGTHFERKWLSMEDLAHKSIEAAVSDVCAMGARPIGLLVQLTLAPWLTTTLLRRLAREQRATGQRLGAPVMGGNLTAGRQLELVTTVLGELPGRALLRSGARPGDQLWLVGSVGRARLGLLALQNGWAKKAALAACLEAFRRPRALASQGRALASRARACLDVSDGLRRDAPRLAEESKVAVVIESRRLERLVDPGFARAARALAVDPLEAMLDGGEDYALLATGPQQQRPRFARAIGRIEAGGGAWLERGEDRVRLRGGFEHRAPGGPAR
jgi:thiamine-monophosphate kinase